MPRPLAGELNAAQGDHATAFKNYEDFFRPLAQRTQESGRRFAGSFLPDTPFKLWFRNTAARFLRFPPISRWFWKRALPPSFPLKDY